MGFYTEYPRIHFIFYYFIPISILKFQRYEYTRIPAYTFHYTTVCDTIVVVN